MVAALKGYNDTLREEMMETGLRDKVVLVTGANHGIGAATAKAFANEGAAVFITYLSLPLDAPFDEKEMEIPGEAVYRSNQAMSADKTVRDIFDVGGRRIRRLVDEIREPELWISRLAPELAA